MKHLTTPQEIELILNLRNLDFKVIDHGMARCVIETPKEIAEQFGITQPSVIKLAIGEGGVVQTQNEINAFLEYGLDYPLAEIHVGGRFIEIMERVTPLDEGYTDYLDYTDGEDYAAQNDTDEAEAIEAFGAAYQLEDIFGSTGDNGQVGKNIYGQIVAYDYGFFADSDHAQTSELSYYLYEGDNVKRYMDGLIALLEHDEDTLASLESELTQKLIDEDEEDVVEPEDEDDDLLAEDTRNREAWIDKKDLIEDENSLTSSEN